MLQNHAGTQYGRLIGVNDAGNCKAYLVLK